VIFRCNTKPMILHQSSIAVPTVFTLTGYQVRLVSGLSAMVKCCWSALNTGQSHGGFLAGLLSQRSVLTERENARYTKKRV